MSQNNRQVWQILDSRNFGGIESHVLQLCLGLKSQGWLAKVVFVQHYGEHPLWPKLKAHGIPYTVCQADKNSLTKMLEQERPALIHTHGYKAGIVTRLLAKFKHIPVISTYHAGEAPTGKVKIYDWIDRYSGFLADDRLAVSQDVKKKVPTACDVTKNFVDIKNMTLSEGQQIAFVGRLSEEKGTDNLLAIARSLPHVDIHCYGDGPDMEKLQANKTANLHLHGQQNDMSQVWPNIGLLLLPSLHEGMPMVALESMARGIPVIASSVGDLPKLIQHGDNGWLKSPSDIKGFNLCIRTWLSVSNERKAKLSQVAQDVIRENYSFEAVMPELVKRYQSLIAA
ncbi:glycosyltransferase family 4 protein [Catenovulum sp. SM1970]|uniref:glycosyltransferase family 4 protein n=1 Tax=Marinifaba aquimaris TaxID=2741323 RepID=UPI00157256C9|nr:glycosyltransferase family 4 protein [Marinifaba aquimaris]NTS76171.1 glycosyltransferase family 4 protein [Marinifaba aquimaris]